MFGNCYQFDVRVGFMGQKADLKVEIIIFLCLNLKNVKIYTFLVFLINVFFSMMEKKTLNAHHLLPNVCWII